LDGSLWGWGSNGHGQIGDGTTTDSLIPIRIGVDNDWVSVSTSGVAVMAIRADGTLWGWGRNYRGQLGDGTITNRHSPTWIGNGWTSVSAGSSHTVAIRTDGSLWAWGWNFEGRTGLGPSATDTTLAPMQIGESTNWVSVSAGSSHTVAIRADGSLWVWGGNAHGQLGIGVTGQVTSRNTPVRIGMDNDWLLIP